MAEEEGRAPAFEVITGALHDDGWATRKLALRVLQASKARTLRITVRNPAFNGAYLRNPVTIRIDDEAVFSDLMFAGPGLLRRPRTGGDRAAGGVKRANEAALRRLQVCPPRRLRSRRPWGKYGRRPGRGSVGRARTHTDAGVQGVLASTAQPPSALRGWFPPRLAAAPRLGGQLGGVLTAPAAPPPAPDGPC
jgi:hypothetical protein